MNQTKSKEIRGMFEGPIVPVTVRLAAPMLIGQTVQLLYMVIDTVFIARIDPSSTAILSGTGLAFPLFFLVMAIGVSISVGVSTITGRIIGENRRELAPRVLSSGLLIATVVAVAALACGYAFSHSFMHLLAGSRMSDEAIGYGVTFFRFLLPGFGLMLISQSFMGMLQGEGRTDSIAKIMVLSTVLNIAFDPLFIFVLRMGVAGAGVATSLSIAIAMAYALYMFKAGGSQLPLTFDLTRSKGVFVREIARIGFPNFLSMAAMSVSFMILNKLVSGIGQTEMNGWTIVGRMDQIVLIPSFAVSGATIAMISQNYGRGNLDRVRSVYRAHILLGIAVVAAVALVYMLVCGLFFPFFSSVKEVVDAAVRQVHLISLTFVGVSAAIISTSAFQATGRPLPALLLSLVRMGLVAIPIGSVLVLWFHQGMGGIYTGLIVGNLAALPIAYAWTTRHLKRLQPKVLGQ